MLGGPRTAQTFRRSGPVGLLRRLTSDDDARMPDADSLHVQFANNPQPIVTFVTTEHYNLQAERAVTTSETNGRAAIFLAALSSGLVALAFIGQASHLGPPFYALALVLFTVLLFLGTVTFARAIQSSIADVVAGARIVRCRRFYLDFAPGLEAYLSDPGRDVAEAMALTGARTGRPQLLLTTAGTLGVLDSVLIGAIAALLGQVTTQEVGVAIASGGLAFVIAFVAYLEHQQRRWVKAETTTGLDEPMLARRRPRAK